MRTCNHRTVEPVVRKNFLMRKIKFLTAFLFQATTYKGFPRVPRACGQTGHVLKVRVGIRPVHIQHDKLTGYPRTASRASFPWLQCQRFAGLIKRKKVGPHYIYAGSMTVTWILKPVHHQYNNVNYRANQHCL